MNRYLMWYKGREPWLFQEPVSPCQNVGIVLWLFINPNGCNVRHEWTERTALLNALMSGILVPVSDALPFIDHVKNKLLIIEWGQVFASRLPVAMDVDGYNVRDAWIKCDNLLGELKDATMWWGKLRESLFDGVRWGTWGDDLQWSRVPGLTAGDTSE